VRRIPPGPFWFWPAVRVRCGGLWHEVQIAHGRLNTFAHTNTEVNRELTLGGPLDYARAYRLTDLVRLLESGPQ
jgi:hypothetical protein